MESILRIRKIPALLLMGIAMIAAPVNAASVDTLIGPGILADQYGTVNIPWSYDLSSRLANAGAGMTITTDDPAHIAVAGTTLTFNYPSATVDPAKAGVEGKAVAVTVTDAFDNAQSQTIYVRVTDTKGTVSGRVLASGVNPVSGAIVSDASTSRAATTDENGNYTLSDMPGGEYPLSAVKAGYVMQTQYVTVNSNQNSSLEFSLQAASAPVITYDANSKTITVVSGVATTASIASAVADPAVFSRIGSSSTVTASIHINTGAVLMISDETIIVNSSESDIYAIKGTGCLKISNSKLATADPAYHSYIDMYVEDYHGATWSFKMLNSEVHNFGSDSAGKFALTLGHLASGSGNTSNSSVIVWNSFVKDSEYGIMLVNDNTADHVKLEGNRLVDLSSTTQVGNAGLIDLGFNGGIFRNNIFSNMVPPKHMNIVWSSGYHDTRILHNEFYNVDGDIIESKHSNNITMSYNYFNGCSCDAIMIGKGWTDPATHQPAYEIGDTVIGNVIKNQNSAGYYAINIMHYSATPTIVKDNTLENIQGNGLYIMALNGLDFENNSINNCSGVAIAPWSGSNSDPGAGSTVGNSNLVFKNNTFDSCQYGIETHGAVYNSVSINDSYTNNLHEDYRLIAGLSFEFKNINTRYSRIALNAASSMAFYNYKYLDIKVVDQSGNSMSGASVTVTGEVNNAAYPSIDINGMDRSSFITGPHGYTALPSESADSIAVLDFTQTSSTTTQMRYTVSAAMGSYTASVTGVDPSAAWYRPAPDTHANTIVLTMTIPPATAYTLTAPAPASGAAGATSGNFTVTPNGLYTGTITVTPSGGGLTAPITLTFSNSAASQSFAITPTEPGAVTLTATSSGGLTDPAPVTYTAYVTGTLQNASWNYPNPVNFTKTDRTTIAYTVAGESDVSIRLFSLSGVPVKTLVDERTVSPGKYYVDWYGDNDGGAKVASGVYLCVAKIGKDTIRKKIVIAR